MADREDREEGDAAPQEEPARPPLEDVQEVQDAPDVPDADVKGEPERPPLDEDAVWAALIAGFDAEPEPGTEPVWPEAENVTAPPPPQSPAKDAPAKEGPVNEGPSAVDTVLPPADRSIVIHPVIKGPRDFELVEDDDDAHFEPPEPPPLPEADVTTKFAWIAVLGGPLLLLAFVLFQLELTWWAILVGVGGFLGGFTTLVARMRTGEDDDDLPGGGAVV